MARIAPAVEPLPEADRNFKAMIFVDQLTPATPSALFVTAPMVPATWVPCRLSSIGSPSTVEVTKFAPNTSSMTPLPSSSTPLLGISPGLVHMFAVRSGCL